MADELKTENKVSAEKIDPAKIKALEVDLKTAFKEGKFDDLKRLAEDLKKLDPENRLTTRLIEKAEKAKAAKLKKANAQKIKQLEKQMKTAFKAGQLMDIAKLAGEIKKLEPENKAVKKIEIRIDKAKAAMDAQLNSEKVKVLAEAAKGLLSAGRLDDAAKKANEILEVEWENSIATKILNKVAKEKSVEAKTLITVSPPKKEEEKGVEKKEGFFSRLFKKKSKAEAVEPEMKKPEETKPVHAGMAALSEIKKPAEGSELAESSEPAESAESAEDNKGKIKTLEVKLKEAQKDSLIPAIKSAIEELKKVEPENKAALKAESKLEKERAVLEKKANKEKVNGLTKEIKEFMKDKEWQKAKDKITALFEVEKESKFGQKMLKKIEKASQVNEPAKAEAPVKAEEKHAPDNDPGKENVFSLLFKKSDDKKGPEVKPIAKEVVKAAPVKSEPVQSSESAESSEPTEAVEAAKPAMPIAPAPTVQKAEAKPPVQPLKPVVPVVPAIKPAPAKPVGEPVLSVPLTTKKPEPIKPAPVTKTGETTKGNIFTKLFKTGEKGKKSSESIIETIVAQTDEVKKEKKVKREAKKKEEIPGQGFMKMSSGFLKFAVAFILITAGFFYVTNIDKENKVMAMFGGSENNALQLKLAAEEVEAKKDEEKKVKKEIKRYSEGYENEHKKTIEKIVNNRLNWPELIKKLNEVTESVYEKNALAQYVQYNNYSYDVSAGQLTVSGTLSDPQGRNLTKLAELEEAFMFYPKAKNDPEDETLPYFYNLQGFNSYAKSFNKTTGRFTSNFSLSLATKEREKK